MARSLIKSVATFGGWTLVSRMLGFVRDMVFANLFGVGAATDAFFVAFKIPNFLRRLFAEGAFSQAFVPVFSEYKAQRSPAELRELVSRVSGTLGGVLLLVTLVTIGAAPLVVMLFAPGFIDQPEKFDLTAEMLRITFTYLPLIALTAMAAGVMNSFGRFAVPAFTPIWLNLSLIGAAVWLAPQMTHGVVGLAWGVLVAGLLQLLFQLPTLQRLGLLTLPRWGWRHEGVQRVMRLMLPGIFGSSVAQINLLLDTVLASFLVSGSVSWLYYSDRLVEFPLGVFGIAIATVILPSLSRRHAEADPTAFSLTLDWALRWVLLIALPATIGLFILAEPILTTLFQYNAFSSHDATLSAMSLRAYALGLLGFILVKVLAPGYYARQDTRTPVRIGVIALVANMVMNLLFVGAMLYLGLEGPHTGLALATALAAYLNAGLLFRGLRRTDIYRAASGWPVFLLRLLPANLLLILFLIWGVGGSAEWFARSALERSSTLAMLIGAAICLYLAVLLLVGIRPAELTGRHLARRRG